MPTFFWIKQWVKLLVLPPAGPLLIALVGLAIAGRHPRRGRQLALAGVICLALLSMPAVGSFLIRCLDRTPAFDMASGLQAQAIVILGGGTRRNAPEYGGLTLGPLTLERIRYGARVARATHLPVLVSGGAIGPYPTEARLMRDALVHEYGIAVRWMEERSRNTHENAVRSAQMLKASGVQRVILIGHSFDFPRSSAEFEEAGIATIRAPTGIPAPDPPSFGDFLPSVAGLHSSYYALYEMLANALFHVTRWM